MGNLNSTNNDINGFNINNVKLLFPKFKELALKYKTLTFIGSQEKEEKLCNIIVHMLQCIRRYRDTSIIDLAKLVRSLYETKENATILISLNNTKHKISSNNTYYTDTYRAIFESLNKQLAVAYSPTKLMQFYNYLYHELLWSEDNRISPIANQSVKGCFFSQSGSKSYKSIKKDSNNDDDIDIRCYLGYKFKENITPFYAMTPEGQAISPTGFTLEGVQTIIKIESTIQKRKESHYLGALLFNLGIELKQVGIFESSIKTNWFTNEQCAYLYDIAGTLKLFDGIAAPDEFDITYSNKEKETFVKKEMIKYNKNMKVNR